MTCCILAVVLAVAVLVVVVMVVLVVVVVVMGHTLAFPLTSTRTCRKKHDARHASAIGLRTPPIVSDAGRLAGGQRRLL
ncbi:hypothetical protein E2C01_060413 [Portunus trituberculatus]|uniref:Uncharacterized protein n=1 Tax=Portunus trituberculatus TaxID=210409 RepID=A0A5B7H8N0_PORTR|nr:hypothetical protein [Portunus trituberculatus]